MSWTTPRTSGGMSTCAREVISPATTTRPVVVSVSQATRERGSWASIASSTASETWSQSLSGWPIETDSEVKSERDMAGGLPRSRTGQSRRERRRIQSAGALRSSSAPRASTASRASGPTARTHSRVPLLAASESSESTLRPSTHSPPRPTRISASKRSASATNWPAGRAWSPSSLLTTNSASWSPVMRADSRRGAGSPALRPPGPSSTGAPARSAAAPRPCSHIPFREDLARDRDVALAVVLDEAGEVLERLLPAHRGELDQHRQVHARHHLDAPVLEEREADVRGGSPEHVRQHQHALTAVGRAQGGVDRPAHLLD